MVGVNSIIRIAIKQLLLCFVVLFGSTSQSQQPAYFLHGENQFEGVHIYDVIQDNQLNYWIATNEGIIKYDSYAYIEISCAKMKGTSVFNFVKNVDGTIYCANLNNQIFQIKNDTCSLFFELSEEDGASDISLLITPENNLWIGARKIFILNNNGDLLTEYKPPNDYFGSSLAYRTVKDKVIFIFSGTPLLLIYENEKFSIDSISFDNKIVFDPENIFNFIQLDGKNYALEKQTKSLYSFDEGELKFRLLPKNKIPSNSESVRMYSENGHLWIAGTLPGIFYIQTIETPNISNHIYQNYFISDVFVDNEGNTLLSTFDKGIIIIPNLQIPDLINIENHDQIVSIHNDAELGVLMGTSTGNLLVYQDYNYKIISDKGIRSIVSIYSHPNFPFVIFDDGKVKAFNKKTNAINDIHTGSLKDVVHTNDSTFYLATNYGVYKFYWLHDNEFKKEEIQSLQQRTYGIEYDSINDHIYISTANGLRLLDANKTVHSVVYKEEQIYANHLLFNASKLFCATKENGILIIEKGEVTGQILPKLNNEYIEIVKFIIHRETIFAKTKKGLVQFDINGNTVRQINKALGFSSNRIIDFDLSDNILWISHSDGIQKLSLDLLKIKIDQPIIKIAKIEVNGKNINPETETKFKSNERKIVFTVGSPTLKNRENITYHFRLIGYDNQWNINQYDNHVITYNALSHGDYVFTVKAENQGVFSETISYAFRIKTPYYYAWWFTTSWLLLFVLIVMLIYWRTLKSQQKKLNYINELNGSKLTAIQSQMNPHFIFNSLNSIQDLILKGDVENSYSYISTFSDLVRRTLNYSDKEFIDFEQEIKLIELYLSLEKLRFKKDFNYVIAYENCQDIMIPPMLIQPFIENALVHGLLHQTGTKKLDIKFTLTDYLTCTITDNGIGRAAAKEIKLRQQKQYDSFSVQAIKKRFEILGNHFNDQLGYHYEDLYENDISCGTRVTLRIPIKHKF